MQTYLFYDIETTGLNKSFDQVLQFAAIRTDLELNELERHEILVRLNCDIIPSPYALITHHIGFKNLIPGIDEFSAIKKIHYLMNYPGTISLGYNTLGFDDEFLRFSFYRNLLPPYTHQFANQCSRMDLYPMVLMYFLFKPDVLAWPEIDGMPSMKLELLNAKNQLATGRTHDAMVDVAATVALAKHLFAKNDMWEYLKGYFNKKIEQERLQPLQNKDTIALAIDGRLRNQFYQTPVMYLSQHRHYKNQFIWLQLDNPELQKTTSDNLTTTTRVINKKLGEPQFILPLKERFTTKLSAERKTLATENQQWLLANPNILQSITDYYANYQYPNYPNTDVEASLYLNGFYSTEEDTFCRLFHRASAEEKATLTEKLTYPNLKKLALRILGRHFSSAMSTAQQEAFSDYLQQTDNMIDFQGKPRMSPQIALRDISEIRAQKQLTEEQNALLIELENYLLT